SANPVRTRVFSYENPASAAEDLQGEEASRHIGGVSPAGGTPVVRVEKMATAERKTRRRKRTAPTLREGFHVATAEDQSSLDQYLKEVSTHRLLTPAEEIELGHRAQAGDEDAVAELVRANLRFVISVAKKYQNRGVSLSDLIQEG